MDDTKDDGSDEQLEPTQRTPVGWFIDPTTTEVVEIVAKESETGEQAIERVTKHHNVTSVDVKPMAQLAEYRKEKDLSTAAKEAAPTRFERRPARRAVSSPMDAASRYAKRVEEERDSINVKPPTSPGVASAVDFTHKLIPGFAKRQELP